MSGCLVDLPREERKTMSRSGVDGGQNSKQVPSPKDKPGLTSGLCRFCLPCPSLPFSASSSQYPSRRPLLLSVRIIRKLITEYRCPRLNAMLPDATLTLVCFARHHDATRHIANEEISHVRKRANIISLIRNRPSLSSRVDQWIDPSPTRESSRVLCFLFKHRCPLADKLTTKSYERRQLR